ncbi:LysR family transcriptional regulator [Pseudoclavibacter chungangensis]|uniref:LysR family transcriptional regulator n=1 Tax=Pseudoclavibacter chungangensis TaxID=587635 RepID=A0A7J5C2I1_9MICO|nr:LysR family transcriptional regulator [Pseudoclavibacter chungangensis]KAB1660253.1 LysR family transcriptional regulator [Pseudoclavibacter chungangensis]NYJ65596.1 DNA-binding transcriptional LysR family regulator [Pseudoclavibacter chungangensis]
MLDVKKLRILRELHLRGTLAEVARALNYSPSAVSQQLSALEAELGVELLRKQGRRVQLTPQAEILVAHTGAVLERLELAELELASSLDRPVGSVRLAVFQSAALALIPDLLRILATEHPGLRVEMVQHEPESSLYRTFAGDFDLVVAEQYPGHAAPHHEGLDRIVLTHDTLRLAVPHGSGLRSIAACAERAWVMEPVGTASRHWGEQQCRLAGFEPDVRYETADLQAQARLITTGHAVGIMNDLTWAHEAPAVEFVDLRGSPRREIFTSARAAAAGSAEIRVVRATLARVAEDLAAAHDQP